MSRFPPPPKKKYCSKNFRGNIQCWLSMTSSLYCKTQTVTESAKLITNLPFNVNFQLYSLLSFVSPGVFSLDAIDEFEERFTDVDDSTGERWESYIYWFF